MQMMIAVTAGILLYSLVLSLVSKEMLGRDAVKRRMDVLEKNHTHNRLSADDELSKPFSERVLKPLFGKFSQSISRMIPSGDGQSAGAAKQKRMLEQTGWSITVDDYNAMQVAAMIIGVILGALLGLTMRVDMMRLLFYALLGGYGGFAILRFVVTSQATKRKKALERQLPDMLDLLSVSVEAGLGFEQALFEITQNMEGPLVDEIAVTYREMSMGRSRRDALILLGERCDTEDVKSFTGALVQAGQLGISIKNVLQAQAAALRRTRRNRVQEQAAKMSTKILLPMLIFIFPVLFIVLLGPSLLSIMEIL